jgi:hypothetical protein
LRACAAFSGDTLIVESERDAVVPHQVVVKYREAFTGARSLTYRMIPGADHAPTGRANQRAYTTILVTWLTEIVFGARGSEGSAPPAIAPSLSSLQPAHEQQDDQDENDKPCDPARIVAPAAAVGPGRQRADKNQYEDD